MRVALFVTCLGDVLFPQVGQATVTVLERLGHEVVFPADQTCCGQMHLNTGYARGAAGLVRHHVEVFERALEHGAEAIVAPSGSCAGSVRHQHAALARRAGDERLARRAEAVAARTYELSELLVDVLGVTDVGARYPHRVTYHPTCHSLRVLRVGDRPLRLLREVRDLTLVELPDAETCCGFGGTFALKNADTSAAILADKMQAVLDTGAEAVTAGDSSCLMHIGGGLSRLAVDGPDGQPVRTVHLAEILAGDDAVGRGGQLMSTYLGIPTARRDVGALEGDRTFPEAARTALADEQLRSNLARATGTITERRRSVVAELPDWEELRGAGSAIKADTMARLPELLEQLEHQVAARGGTVHWARDATEANRIVTELVRATGADEVVKVKSMATQEIGLNDALAEAGITAIETDLAELIVQLDDDRPSHILVPAIHKNRNQIRDIFVREMPDADPQLSTDPPALAEAARVHLRRTFLRARVAVSGANFAVADTGTLVVVESEGNGRMCLTLPETLITVMGIEKLVPTWTDLEVFLQLLPRSATGERMNPYTSAWTGVTPGDGPQSFHLVLLDNGRSAALADPLGRTALHCIRCSACLNVCPVYRRTGGHAYGAVYPGPIGAVLAPQLTGITGKDDPNDSLPYASSLCGACFDACPVKIDIPSLLVDLRMRHVEARAQGSRRPDAEAVAMAAAAYVMGRPSRFARAGRTARIGRWLLHRGRPRRHVPLPGPLAAWTATRDLPTPPDQTFREWWSAR